MEPNNPPPPVVLDEVPKMPKPLGAGAGLVPKSPVDGAGAALPNGLDCGFPNGLDDGAAAPNAPVPPVDVAPKGLAGAAPNPLVPPVVVAPNPPAAGAGAVPNGVVEVVRPKAEVPVLVPKAVDGAPAGAPNILGLLLAPNPPVLLPPKVCAGS